MNAKNGSSLCGYATLDLNLFDFDKHSCLFSVYISVIEYKNMSEIKKNANDYLLWLTDSGKPTYDSFKELSKDEQTRVLDYLKTFLVYDEIKVAGNSFFLSHSVPSKEKMLDFESCKWQDFVLGGPNMTSAISRINILSQGIPPQVLFPQIILGKYTEPIIT